MLLLVAHGSRRPEAAAALGVLSDLVRERVHVEVRHGWLERSQPLAVDVAATAAPGQRLVVVPLLLFRAYHASEDVPAVVAAARAAGAGEVHVADVLGPDAALVRGAADAVVAVRGDGGSASDALVLLGTGTSDPGAQAALAAVAGEIAAAAQLERWRHAFVSLAPPDPAAAVDAAVDDGAGRIVTYGWNVLPGVLPDRGLAEVRAAAARRGVPVVEAGSIGPTPTLADVVVARYRAALAG